MKKILFFIILIFSNACLFAQSAYWKSIRENEAKISNNSKDLFENTFRPSVYKLFSLDESAFRTFIKNVPVQKNISIARSSFTIPVPAADGSLQHFNISESPVMESKLQAKYPEIKTYIGIGIENPSAVIRFDVTPLGFHAIILYADKSTVYINPVANANQVYVVFDRDNITQEKQVFDCKVDQVLNSKIQGVAQPLINSDANLRTYRFAVATGGEFSKLFLNGTETTTRQKKAKVLAGLVTDLVRTNAIFETDFGVHLNYVNSEDTVIFLNGATDPFQSSPVAYFSGAWNTQAQNAMDSYIGSANYDIGHLLMGYNTGGNAGCIGCVCKNGSKGAGVTGFKTDLTSDPFIVDFWDHEIGHQFGANHTFDYSFETPQTGVQMEPGSGSTIMGYAGTTGSTDIQPHSDPYFHAVSIQQVYTYISSGAGAGCAIKTPTGNKVPVANAGANYTIPKSTPFSLKATSTNIDGDSLTYCWEQYDAYKNDGTSNTFPDSASTSGPVFRSYSPTTYNNRNFPKRTSILDGTNKNQWEVLPAVSRTLNFRVTVRDNHANGGATASDDMVVTVDGNSGPFLVTAPNTNVSWPAGSTQTVKWNVANTNLAPVNCAAVDILLSYDGGSSWPVTLKSGTPNDGNQTITVPAKTSNKARIKVVASNNIFFDISNASFKIVASALADNFSSDAVVIKDLSVENISVRPNPAHDYTNIIFNKNYSHSDVVVTNEQGKIVFTKVLGSINKGNVEKVSLQQFAPGVYFLKISTDNETKTQKIIKD